MSRFVINDTEFQKLQEAMKAYSGNVESAINEVLHNDASPIFQDSIKRLIPVSGRTWSGKPPAAKTGNSLTDEKGNLSITVKTTKKYHYLYFPNDGTNTKRHAGNQQFFVRGVEAKQSEVIDRCVERLVSDFENSM